MPVKPICTAGSLIGGECLVGLTGGPDHYQRGVLPVFINGTPVTTALDLSTGHSGYVGPSLGAVANMLDGLVPVTVDPGLTVLTRVFVNGVPVARAGDQYFAHPDPLDPTLFHEICVALADQTAVFAV
jgi:hypothetical protein